MKIVKRDPLTAHPNKTLCLESENGLSLGSIQTKPPPVGRNMLGGGLDGAWAKAVFTFHTQGFVAMYGFWDSLSLQPGQALSLPAFPVVDNGREPVGALSSTCSFGIGSRCKWKCFFTLAESGRVPSNKGSQWLKEQCLLVQPLIGGGE